MPIQWVGIAGQSDRDEEAHIMTREELLTLMAVAVRTFGDNDSLTLKKSVYEELGDSLAFETNQDENGDITLHLVED